MDSSVKYRFHSCVAIFSAHHIATRYESICNDSPKTSRKVSESEIYVETGTHSLSSPTNLQCDIAPKFVHPDVGAASLQNPQCSYMDCDVSSGGKTN